MLIQVITFSTVLFRTLSSQHNTNISKQTCKAIRTGIISAILDSPSILRDERHLVKRTVSPRHTKSSAPIVHLLMFRWHTLEAGLRNAANIWKARIQIYDILFKNTAY